MFNKHKKFTDTQVGAIIDIGSGSVGAAIVHINNITHETNIVWSHRENLLLKVNANLTSTEHALRTALINVFLELGNAGTKTLNEFDSKARIGDILASMSAPWSYVSSKNVTLEDEKPFVVDDELLEELSKIANEEATQKVYENQSFSKFGVKIISQKNVAIRINGYRVSDQEYYDKKATEISFTHLTNLATLELCDTLDEIQEKILPRARLEVLPFIYVFYRILQNQYDNTLEGCIIDITNEATELGIVRNGALKSVSYIPVGSFTIAREIARKLDVPTEQAFSYLRRNPEEIPDSLSAGQKKELASIISDYQKNLKTLFQNTGDDLAIPRSLFIHTDANTGDFFNYVIKNSANLTTNNTHTAHPLTEKIISESHSGDTAILAAVKFYTDNLQ